MNTPGTKITKKTKQAIEETVLWELKNLPLYEKNQVLTRLITEDRDKLIGEIRMQNGLDDKHARYYVKCIFTILKEEFCGSVMYF